ncbi:MAG: lysophospholipid acyltransferase family protein [Planctomycetota bacterium]|jgi:lysophospholipid acyltransferase (LPLAT)-like uncharacterized protein
MGRRKLSHRVGPFLAKVLGPTVIRSLGFSWRVRLEPEDFAKRVRGGEPAVFTIWHNGMLVPTYLLRGGRHAVMISRHSDGEVIARIVERLGFTTVRGSSTRGGATALQGAVQVLKDGVGAAFTPDGPRGPARKAQPGAVFAASRSGVPITPVGIGVRSAWTMKSWDRFRIPKPFTVVSLVEGDPIEVPPDIEGEEMERYQRILEEAIDAADARAQELAEG